MNNKGKFFINLTVYPLTYCIRWLGEMVSIILYSVLEMCPLFCKISVHMSCYKSMAFILSRLLCVLINIKSYYIQNCVMTLITLFLLITLFPTVLQLFPTVLQLFPIVLQLFPTVLQLFPTVLSYFHQFSSCSLQILISFGEQPTLSNRREVCLVFFLCLLVQPQPFI